MTQGYNNLINILNSMPGQQDIGRAINKYLPSKIEGINYEVQPQSQPQYSRFNIGDSKQIGYKLPDGTYTSNRNLVDIAKQQMTKANRMALAKTAGKGLGLLSTAIPFYKDIALPVANDLYQGFILGNTDKSKTLQKALNLAGIDINGNVIPIANKNSIKSEPVSKTSKTGRPDDVPDFEILDDASLGAINKVQADRASQMAHRLGLPKLPPIVTGSNSTGTTPTVSSATEVVTPEQQANSQAVIDYINKLQQINQPYIDALTNYYNNYDKYLKNYDRMRRFYTGLAGWTGNQKWADFAEGYNPVKNEAQKVALIKQLQDAKAGDVNAINEAIGNMAVAQELGLPLETAFANKNLLTSLSMRDRDETKKAIALENALVKYYGIDRNNARAIAVQKLRNEGNYNTAMLNAMMFGGMMPYGYQPAPGLNMQGSVPMMQMPIQQPAQGGVDTGKALTLEQILSNAQQQNNR